nr:OmpA family protein [Legionellales bacterium]
VAAGTDKEGSKDYNKKLAGRRANTVKNLLLKLKVPENQIQINTNGAYAGPEFPAAGTDQDKENWRKTNEDYRFVTLSFPGLKTKDKITPPKPPVTRDRPERVQINRMEVFIKK